MIGRAAVIDMGSNSVKMAAFLVGPDGPGAPYRQEGARTRLGGDLHETGELGAQQMERTAGALALYRDIIRGEGISHVVPVATSAVRDAANGAEFLDDVAGRTGYRFRVLSEREEALYSYMGAARSLRQPTAVYFDLGGGSLEIVSAEHYEVRKVLSLRLGALRLTRRFADKKSAFTAESYGRMAEHVAASLPGPEELGLGGGPRPALVGVGGSLRAVAKHDQAARGYPLGKVHNYRLRAGSAGSIGGALARMGPKRAALLGTVSPGRAETVAAGACVAHALAGKLGSREIIVGAQGLREGALAASLAFPHEFSGETVPHTVQVQDSVRFACEPDAPPRHAESLAAPLAAAGLLSGSERAVLAQSLRYVPRLDSFGNLETLLRVLLDEDSHLSHAEQLVAALAAVHSRRRRVAEGLFERYGAVLGEWRARSVRKISALAAACAVLERAGTDARVSLDGRGGAEIGLPGAGSGFPWALFGEACSRLSGALGLEVACAPRRGGAPRPEAAAGRRGGGRA